MWSGTRTAGGRKFQGRLPAAVKVVAHSVECAHILAYLLTAFILRRLFSLAENALSAPMLN